MLWYNKAMNRRYLPLVAVLLAVAGCDFKETRSGQMTLTGSTGIPLSGLNGSAELVAGKTEITFKKGSDDNSINIRVRQPNRPEIELNAKVAGDYTTGNFTLKGSEIGQPVDMASARAYAITGPRERYTNWENQGSQRCLVEVTYDPCDENWNVAFRALSGAELGSFAARTMTRCNERSNVQFCHQDPSRDYPRPDFPRGGRHGILERASEIDPANLKFD